MGRRLADLLHGRRRLQLGLLLAGPIGWLGVAYLGSLAVLFIAAFWHLDTFSGKIVHSYGTGNFETLWNDPVYRKIVAADGRDRRGGDGDRRAARVPDRVLHGEGRHAARARAAGRGGADAAVVVATW